MASWWKLTFLLCLYGIFKEVRPSEPYLTEYLTGPWLNFTNSQVDHDIYPVWTYSYLFCLFIVLLVTDFVRYKPVLVIEGLSYITTWSLLLWTKSLFSMQMMQAAYGVATSTEVAYFSCIYAQVSENVFQTVTAFVRAALLFGRFASGILSQVLISTGSLDYHTLNYVSFASVSAAFLTSLLLPWPKRSIFADETHHSVTSCNSEQTVKRTFVKTLKYMLHAAKACYSDRSLIMWSVWWAVATSGNIQVNNYGQVLWERILPTANKSMSEAGYNGAVEASHTLLSSLAALTLSRVHVQLAGYSVLILSTLSFVDSALIVIMAKTKNIWVAYVTYVLFNTLYQLMITIVSYHVAAKLKPDSHGLIFGINTFAALILQTLITVIFVDRRGFHLDIRDQYLAYGVYFAVLGALFIGLGLVRRGLKTKRQNKDSQNPATSSQQPLN